MLHVGFTGTRRGMTTRQELAFQRVLGGLGAVTAFHHGDCIGADYQAHEIAAMLDIPIVIHPPIDGSRRAFCATSTDLASWCVAEIRKPLPYLERNRAIVDASSVLIAVPYEARGSVPRSGTWSTVRYAVKRGVTVIVIRPDGTVEEA